MKIKYIIIVYLIYISIVPVIYAQKNTQVGLPDGAIARLGKGGINVMQFSPDGMRLAVGTTIGVWLYSVEDEIELALPTGNIKNFTTLAFSSDGKILASGGIINPGIQIWNTENGRLISTIIIPDYFFRVGVLAFSDDSKTIIGIGANRHITKWDVNTGDEISKKEVYFNRPVHEVSDDGSYFASGHTRTGEIRIWNTESGIYGNKFQEKIDMSRVAPLPSFAVEKPEERQFIGGIQTLAYSPDRNTIVSAHNNHCLRIWDIKNKLERYTLIGHKEKINSVAYSSDSKIVASGSFDNTIHVWNVETGKLKDILLNHQNSVNALAFSPTENELLASGSADGTVRLWNIDSGQQHSIFTNGFIESVKTLAFTEDNIMLLSAADNGTIQMWNVKTGKEIPFRLNAHYDTTIAAAFSADATLYVSHGSGTKVESNGSGISTRFIPQKQTRLWKLTTGDELLSIPMGVISLSLSNDNKMLAIGKKDDTIIYDIDTSEELHRISASHFFNSEAVCFSPDNTILATCGDRGEVELWDVKSGEKLTTLDDPFVGEATSFEFSLDGSILAAKYSGRIRFWDMSTKKQIYQTLAGKVKVVDILTISPDRRFLFTSKWNSKDGSSIHLWDLIAERELYQLTGHYKKIEVMKFSHDGKVLATGGNDGSILLWDMNKIIDIIGEVNIGKLADKESINVIENPQYASNEEKGQAVMKWLSEQEYKLERIGDKCKIAQGKSRVMMIGTKGGAMIMQDVKFEFSRDGILRINVKGIGMSNFTFNEKGELQYLKLAENEHDPN